MDEKSGYTVPIIPAIYPVDFPALPIPAHSPNKAVKKGTNRFIGNLSFSNTKTPSIPEETTPPPYEATTPLSSKSTARPPSNGSSKSKLQVSVPLRPELTTLSLNTGVAPSPIPSPRTSSYGAYAPDSAWKTPATSRPRSKSIGEPWFNFQSGTRMSRPRSLLARTHEPTPRTARLWRRSCLSA